MKRFMQVLQTALLAMGVILVVAEGTRIGAAIAQEGPEKGEFTENGGTPPPSTIVEIQNHGERFFDESDAAALAFNDIAAVDEVREAARKAKQAADASPKDEDLQAAYRAAKARLLHTKVLAFRKALGFEEAVRQAHTDFVRQLDVEITAVTREVEGEQKAVKQKEQDEKALLKELREVKSRLPRGAADLESTDLQLMREIERKIKMLENEQMLAKERQLLASDSLLALEETKVEAGKRFRELQDEFVQGRGDLKILYDIAYNDLKYENHEERTRMLARFKNRRPINTAGNREVLDELLARNRERLAKFGNRGPVFDDTDQKNRERVDEFLNNLPPEEELVQESGDLVKN
jgi:hypothetical protein